MTLTCGVDWAEAHHDIALVDDDGALVARARIDTGATGFNAMLALIAEHGGSVEDTPIAMKPTRTCSLSPRRRLGSRCTRSTRGRWPAIESGTARPGGNPTPATLRCSRTFAHRPAHAPRAAGAE